MEGKISYHKHTMPDIKTFEENWRSRSFPHSPQPAPLSQLLHGERKAFLAVTKDLLAAADHLDLAQTEFPDAAIRRGQGTSRQFVRPSCQDLQFAHQAPRANVTNVPFLPQKVVKPLSGTETVLALTSLSASSLNFVIATRKHVGPRACADLPDQRLALRLATKKSLHRLTLSGKCQRTPTCVKPHRTRCTIHYYSLADDNLDWTVSHTPAQSPNRRRRNQ